MIGFIKKDLAVIKSNFKLIALLIVVYSIMGFSGEMDFSFILPFMAVMIMMSSFSYDSYNKWDAYAVTLPDGRKNGVRSKYVTTLLFILIMAIITMILSIGMAITKGVGVNMEMILLTHLGTIFGTLLVLIFLYPIIYKFGLERARVGIFIVVFGIVIIGGLVSKVVDLSNIFDFLSFLENYWVIAIILTAVIMTYTSYRIALSIQMKKEF